MSRSVLLPVGQRPKERASPKVLKQILSHVASKVSASWAWYDQSQGLVEWTFTNADDVQHSVVLLRNGYYFAGAFWPVYYANSSGRGASATNPADNFGVDWATALTPLVDNGVANNSPPIAIVDFGSGQRQVYFVFTLAPGESWSMLEGGFSAAMTPSGISLYEVTLEKSGQFCVTYDKTRVLDWDAQTGTNLQGYSPNPSAFDTIEVQVESDAPYDVLPFNDKIADGPCAPQPGPAPVPCSSYFQDAISDLNARDAARFVSDVLAGLECVFTSGLVSKAELVKRVVGEAPQEVKDAIERWHKSL